MTTLSDLTQLEHSSWLHYLRRSFIESGELSTAIDNGVRGVVVDLAVTAQSITASSDYDRFLPHLLAEGTPFDDLPRLMLSDDVQRAAFVLNPVYEASERLDGYVSLPLHPAMAHDTTKMAAAARHVLAEINCPNVMIEIPATEAGIAAIEMLTEDGVCVNATQIFSPTIYERVVDAYLAGLARYVKTHSVWRRWPMSVATIAISRVDGMADAWLDEHERPDLKGKAGIALAKVVFGAFQRVFTGSRWHELAKKGGVVQRPLFTDLIPHDFRYPNTYYVDALGDPGTVCNLTPAMLAACLNRKTAVSPPIQNEAEAQAHLNALSELGLDLDEAARQLQADGLARLARDFEAMRESVRQKREQLEDKWQRLELHLGAYETAVSQTLARTCHDRVVCRIWNHDHTVWSANPAGIGNRLGWLHLMPVMREQISRLQAMTDDLLTDGFTDALLLGMGGAGLVPQLFADTFTQAALPARPGLPARPHLRLNVLSNVDPGEILAQTEKIDPVRTIFVVTSKSGRTIETLSAFTYFYNRVEAVVGEKAAGSHFIAITDPGSPLAELAAQYRFRYLFVNQPDLIGRFGALSMAGFVPAALAGVNLETLLERAEEMANNAQSCNSPQAGDNVAAQLGTALATLAQQGRDKLTFVASPALAGFADWVEQLIAGSLGKQGRGILPVVGEPVGEPAVYGDDRLFVHLRLDGDEGQDTAVSTLIDADFPVITVHWRDLQDVGGQFFLWQMATAVAAHHLQVNPFSQFKHDAAKARTWEVVEQIKRVGEMAVPEDTFTPFSRTALYTFLDKAETGDYVAIQAFIPHTAANDEALQALRTHIRGKTGLATTIGYGPRCLHTVGQMHKGDRGNGLFIQFVADSVPDVFVPNRIGQPEASLSFGELSRLQAALEAQALRRERRRLVRFQLGLDAADALWRLLGEGVRTA